MVYAPVLTDACDCIAATRTAAGRKQMSRRRSSSTTRTSSSSTPGTKVASPTPVKSPCAPGKSPCSFSTVNLTSTCALLLCSLLLSKSLTDRLSPTTCSQGRSQLRGVAEDSSGACGHRWRRWDAPYCLASTESLPSGDCRRGERKSERFESCFGCDRPI